MPGTFLYQRPVFHSTLAGYLVYIAMVYIILFYLMPGDHSPHVVLSIIVLAVLYDMLRSSAFRISGEQIEFFHPVTRKRTGSIRTGQLMQVRYEDDFQSVASFVRYILIYPADPSMAPGRPRDRIRLYVSRERDVSALLQYFDQQGCDIRVRTRSQKLIRETGLENWNEVARTK